MYIITTEDDMTKYRCRSMTTTALTMLSAPAKVLSRTTST